MMGTASPPGACSTRRLRVSPPHPSLQGNKELRECDGKIVECTWDVKGKQWKFLRIRTDKSFPNAFNTATSKCTASLSSGPQEDEDAPLHLLFQHIFCTRTFARTHAHYYVYFLVWPSIPLRYPTPCMGSKECFLYVSHPRPLFPPWTVT